MKYKRKLLILFITTLQICIITKINVDNTSIKENETKNSAGVEKEEGKIFLNLQDTSLKDVLSYICEQKNINVIPDKDLDAIKITMTTREALTLEQAWNVLLTLLETNGFSIVNVDGLHRVVPAAKSKISPLPIFVNVDPETLPEKNLLIRYIYFFKNIKFENVKDVFSTFIPNSYTENTNLNAVLITETGLNIKSIMKIIKELDTSGLREELQILQLEEANADEIAAKFKDILGQNQTQEAQAMQLMRMAPQKRISYFSKDVKIFPEPRNNKLILLGPSDSLKTIVDFIKKYLDKPLSNPNSRLHVKEIKYVDVVTLAPILSEVIKSSGDPKSQLSGVTKFFEDTKITAENPAEMATKEDVKPVQIGAGNRLIVACNAQDWNRIESFIEKLDKPSPQVAIEVFFVGIEHSTGKNIGTQIRDKNGISPNMHFVSNQMLDAQTQKESMYPKDASTTIWEKIRNVMNVPNLDSTGGNNSFLSLGKVGNIFAMIQALSNETNAKILSQPYLVLKNHLQGKVELTEERMMDGKLDTSSSSQSLNKEKVYAKSEVKITPNINNDGIINLKIDIDISDFASSTDASSARVLRKIHTSSTVYDGEVIVTGGLRQEKETSSITQAGPLAKIPLIGLLFQNRAKTVQKTDIFVFIRPVIIKPKFEGKPDDYTQLKLDYTKLQLKRQKDLSVSSDPIENMFFHSKSEELNSLAKITKEGEIVGMSDFVEGKDLPKSTIPYIDPFLNPKSHDDINNILQLVKKREKISEKQIKKLEVNNKFNKTKKKATT